jgi:hypothetical protein
MKFNLLLFMKTCIKVSKSRNTTESLEAPLPLYILCLILNVSNLCLSPIEKHQGMSTSFLQSYTEYAS